MTRRGGLQALFAVGGNIAIAAATFARYGWNVAGAQAAARYTARFAVLWFAAGFAAPGLARFIRILPTEAQLIQAYVGAHMVHFAVVAVVLATFERALFLKNPTQSAGVVLGGFAVVLSAGLTASPRPVSQVYSAAHKATLYVILLIFFLAYVQNPVRPLRFMAALLGVALILRLVPGAILSHAPSKAAD